MCNVVSGSTCTSAQKDSKHSKIFKIYYAGVEQRNEEGVERGVQTEFSDGVDDGSTVSLTEVQLEASASAAEKQESQVLSEEEVDLRSF